MKVADADAMRAFGRALGNALSTQRARALVVTIRGELGAGKTTFVGGVLNALGFQGFARSPTYTLIEPYEFAGRQVFHLDLYRLADPGEVEALGLRDLLNDDAVLLIEWPERGAGLIPPADLALTIDYAAEGRVLDAAAHGQAGRELLQRLVQM
ncbi:MAG TPA: tRNA (adenosine(37)-N6)-threonylcarbamoyltransferase complex ATPase subunit type 1 TsaE [Povalibacter sp.]|uniref:tRNA (adenosine(37)-N6)-threonylcarbamoyltransferase complex ATPase subunit type 1 TsaE n=1 Tax=Povalibacter sp. TaxID=1962978 RepID=UPI002CA769BF|nr:tRNA (adenosine(37)-N6)-threonylcarbamoyltransferase complex ATPase subunit type 1 TsaE [Povalibacter sp.]HMN43430.1 tRNA (adenosine(37)-N6)-threonylcarbamoyltransferase complex ATPase subunit type 1 TsaE [Povalibacter sp.]